jgi:hypothetical protein
MHKRYDGVDSVELKPCEKALNERGKDRNARRISLGPKQFFLRSRDERIEPSRYILFVCRMYRRREIRMERLAESCFFSRCELVVNERVGHRSNRFS